MPSTSTASALGHRTSRTTRSARIIRRTIERGAVVANSIDPQAQAPWHHLPARHRHQSGRPCSCRVKVGDRLIAHRDRELREPRDAFDDAQVPCSARWPPDGRGAAESAPVRRDPTPAQGDRERNAELAVINSIQQGIAGSPTSRASSTWSATSCARCRAPATCVCDLARRGERMGPLYTYEHGCGIQMPPWRPLPGGRGKRWSGRAAVVLKHGGRRRPHRRHSRVNSDRFGLCRQPTSPSSAATASSGLLQTENFERGVRLRRTRDPLADDDRLRAAASRLQSAALDEIAKRLLKERPSSATPSWR